jgi:hypothetical protein
MQEQVGSPFCAIVLLTTIFMIALPICACLPGDACSSTPKPTGKYWEVIAEWYLLMLFGEKTPSRKRLVLLSTVQQYRCTEFPETALVPSLYWKMIVFTRNEETTCRNSIIRTHSRQHCSPHFGRLSAQLDSIGRHVECIGNRCEGVKRPGTVAVDHDTPVLCAQKKHTLCLILLLTFVPSLSGQVIDFQMKIMPEKRALF